MKNYQRSLSSFLKVQGSDISKSQLIILILPALGAPTKLYMKLYDEILKADISVSIMNLRGEGLLNKEQLVSEGNFGYVDLLKDIDDVILFLTHKFPDKKIVTLGHSLGGQLGCLYSCNGNPHVLASIVIAGGNVWYKSWKGIARLKIFTATQIIGIISRLLGWFPGGKIGFGGNQPKNLMVDWSRNAQTGNYKIINQKIGYETECKNVKILFLGLVIPNDTFAPYNSIKNLLDKFSLSDREIFIIKTENFKKITPDHFRWLKEPEPVINIFISWLDKKGLLGYRPPMQSDPNLK